MQILFTHTKRTYFFFQEKGFIWLSLEVPGYELAEPFVLGPVMKQSIMDRKIQQDELFTLQPSKCKEKDQCPKASSRNHLVPSNKTPRKCSTIFWMGRRAQCCLHSCWTTFQSCRLILLPRTQLRDLKDRVKD